DVRVIRVVLEVAEGEFGEHDARYVDVVRGVRDRRREVTGVESGHDAWSDGTELLIEVCAALSVGHPLSGVEGKHPPVIGGEMECGERRARDPLEHTIDRQVDRKLGAAIRMGNTTRLDVIERECSGVELVSIH